jgi:hypothetical protein
MESRRFYDTHCLQTGFIDVRTGAAEYAVATPGRLK